MRKWLSLLLLMVGVVIVQMGGEGGALTLEKDAHSHGYFPRSLDELVDMRRNSAVRVAKRSATYEGIEEDIQLTHPRFNPSLGLLAVVGACLSSGLAGVYLEKVLKDSVTPVSLWVRNVQLAFYSVFPALFIGVVMVDGESVSKMGFFAGYNWVVWTTVTLQAVGGLLVALCLNFADILTKNVATSMSVVFTAIASSWFFDFSPNGTVRILSFRLLSRSEANINGPSSSSSVWH